MKKYYNPMPGTVSKGICQDFIDEAFRIPGENEVEDFKDFPFPKQTNIYIYIYI